MFFTIKGLTDEHLSASTSTQEGLRRPLEFVVAAAEAVAAVIPGVKRLAGGVIEHPSCAGLHTGLVDAVTKHVIVVTHYDAVLGIDDLPLVAFDIKEDMRLVKLLGGRVRSRCFAVLEPVVRYRENRASQRIGMRDSGRSR
ncbi:MAG: hypothetical protein GY697_28300, partial [Desulfobacterales bacterium]|nr:hypothetical protein [Desulfobacterales bacterium]